MKLKFAWLRNLDTQAGCISDGANTENKQQTRVQFGMLPTQDGGRIRHCQPCETDQHERIAEAPLGAIGPGNSGRARPAIDHEWPPHGSNDGVLPQLRTYLLAFRSALGKGNNPLTWAIAWPP